MGRLIVTAQELTDIAQRPVGSGQGLLAMDKINATRDKQFTAELASAKL